MVVFNSQGRWSYMDEDYDAPVFDSAPIDQSVLQDALDAVEDTGLTPCVFELRPEAGWDGDY